MSESNEITINIRCTNGDKYSVKTTLNTTVEAFKLLVEEVSSIPAAQQRLIFSGAVLKDHQTLESVKVSDGVSIHLVKGVAKKSAPAGNAAPSSSTTTGNSGASSQASSSAPPQSSSSQPTGPAGVPPVNPFAAFAGGAPGAGAGAGAFGLPPGVDMAQVMQMMNDPAVQQMMQQMMSNPQLMAQMMQNNPYLAGMGQQNPMMQQMMQNPAMLQSMMGGGAAGAGAGAGAGASGAGAAGAGAGAAGAGAPDLASLMAQMGSMGAMGGSPSPAASTQPPEERFASQLIQLGDMGFVDRDQCIQALLQTNGNVQAAIERLLSQ